MHISLNLLPCSLHMKQNQSIRMTQFYFSLTSSCTVFLSPFYKQLEIAYASFENLEIKRNKPNGLRIRLFRQTRMRNFMF